MDEERGYMARRERWMAVRTLSRVSVVKGMPKKIIIVYKRNVLGINRSSDCVRV
jgi:hypothetical protein